MLLCKILLACLALSLLACVTPPKASRGTFTNPVDPTGHDPWVLRHDGRYYYCVSRGGAICIASSPNLTDVASADAIEVWRPPAGTDYSSGLWAPELHRLGDAWYIYVAADDGDNYNHRMQVLRREAATPDGPFERVGELELPDDRWAIDGTPFEHDGQLYHIWSGWPGEENVTQNLYICRMKDPVTPVGERVLISKPEYDWEKAGSGDGLPTINEGPTQFDAGDRSFVIYSAGGSWSDFYCLGLLELVGDDPMDADAWRKSQTPWFKGTDTVVSPGHASVTESPDGSETWLVYHTARHPGAGWNRDVNLQQIRVSSSGRPVAGKPLKGTPITRPSGEVDD